MVTYSWLDINNYLFICIIGKRLTGWLDGSNQAYTDDKVERVTLTLNNRIDALSYALEFVFLLSVGDDDSLQYAKQKGYNTLCWGISATP